jgi:serine/threonine protein kinase/DNA-binding SARP family transcriptional activator/ABC-type transport system substrate-binding protein
MEFRILGPLEVSGDDGPRKLGGPKQHAVLAHLILRSNHVVPAGLLIDELWGEEPPETARNTLQTYVYRLRKVLGEARIEAGSGGYLLHAEPHEIDAGRFESLVKRAKALTSDPRARLVALDEALALWRGDALADLSEEPSLRGEIARLEELRLAATEHRISTELAMGSHTTVISELEALTGRYPLRERLWAHLMLALYRGGRQAEALDAYERARQVLASELGSDPSTELQRLHQQILSQDPELRASSAPAPASALQASTGDLEPGAEFSGYRIDRIIGRGGMGVVYLAEHEGLKRKVALKLLAPQLAEDPRFRERFVRESQLAASIDHPNVIPIYEAGEAEGRLYIAMRFVDGTDLRTLLHEQGTLGPAQTSRIVGQVAAALDAAHELGLVHRDVKPANVLIARQRGTETGAHGYLTDFGLTKRAASDSGITGTGQFVGTLDYAAPEQFRGEVPDARTDVYSLGCVLFECLAGHPPYRAENDAALMFAHLMEPPPRLTSERPDLPQDIDDVVAEAMAKKPDERFPSAGAFASQASAVLGHPIDEYSPDRPVQPRRSSQRSPSHRRRRITIGAVATVVIIILIAGLLQIVGSGSARASFQPGISIVDQVTGEAMASIPTSEVRQPAEVIHADGSFWVHNLDPNSFVEIDPRAGKVLTQIAAPFEDVGAFAIDGDTLWVTGPSVVKIDIGLRREVDRFDLPQPTHGVVVADGSLWVTMPIVNTTLRLDPTTGQVEHRFSDLPGSLALAYGDGSVWTAGWTSPFSGFTGSGGVNRIDPDTNTITTTEIVLPVDCCPVAAGGGFGWTSDPTKGIVYKIDQSGQIAATPATGAGATVGSYDDGMVWIGNSDVGTVVGIESLTGARRAFRFEHPVQGVAAGSGVLLVTLGPGSTYEELIDGLEGDVVRLFIQPGRLNVPDPATMTSDLGFWVEFATCAKLLNYPDAPSPDGWNLQPEVAVSMPDVSADGRTYTFTVRSDYRFSPPSGETVTAETFRYSIERAISFPPRVGGYGRFHLYDLEGEREFLRGEADHISGLRVSGDTLTISLTQPSSDFLQRLSVPLFCPVPTDTPLVPGGAAAFSGYPHRVGLAVPSAGPYFIADHLDGEYAILKRNPNYTGPRTHAFDAIGLREGVDPGLAVGLVEDGAWDGVAHVFDPLLTPSGPVAEKYGAEDASEDGLRYYATPSPVVGFFAFNASRPPFSDPDVRRAAALAIDREALAAIWGNTPSDQLLPPVIPGFEDLELYPLDGSELDEARSLMGGRTVTAVFGIFQGSGERERQEAEVVRTNLAPIGITVEIEEFPFRDVFAALRDPDVEIDLLGAGIGEFYPDPATYLHDMLTFTMPREWLPSGVSERVFALFELTGEEQRSAAAELATELATDDVPVAVDLYGAIPSLLSPSLGCRVFPPFGYGVDLAALCPSQA